MNKYNIVEISRDMFTSKDISLRKEMREVKKEEFKKEWLTNLVGNMIKTLYTSGTGVGLAAPQIGFQLKIAIMDIKRDAKKPIVMINPSYESIDDQIIDSTESCLSIPGYVGLVKRYKKIRVKYNNMSGDLIEEEVEGFKATVMQHEIDHLNGILYIDRMEDEEDIKEYDGYLNVLAERSMENIK
ncbi:MAG: peptide deformylase [Clostridia bacterium]|jgi:peptide deformylase|nr:peptide deformylase [Clostridia bacterium]